MRSTFYQLVISQLALPGINNRTIWKLFYLTCKKGETEAARYLLLYYPQLKFTVTSKMRNSGLWIACFYGQLETAKYLVEEGFSLTTKNIQGCSLFYAACINGHLHVLKWLANECNADINAISKQGGSPIGEACFNGHLHIVEWLLEKAKVKTKIPNHQHLITIASCSGQLHIVKYLLTVCRMSFHDAITIKGQTPLIATVIYNRLPVLEFYLQEGYGTVNEITPQGKTLLWIACYKGHLDIVRWLVEKGNADVEKTDSKGRSPLFIACEEDHLEVVDYILTCGKANPNVTFELGKNSLLLACQKGNFQMVKVLIDAGADLNGAYGTGPMHVACMNGNIEVVKYLISENLSVYALDDLGESALHYSLMKGHLDLIRYLLDRYHSIIPHYSSNSLIQVSFMKALRKGDVDIIRVITSRILISEEILELYQIPYNIRNFVRLGRNQYFIRRFFVTFLSPLVSDNIAFKVLGYLD